MSVRRIGAGGLAFLALSACATGAAGPRPAADPPPTVSPPSETPAPPAAAAPESPVPTVAAAEPAAPAASAQNGGDKLLPPCEPVRHARPKHHKPKQTPAAESAASSGPPPPAPADAVVDAKVGEVGTSLGSILGRDVTSPKGEDLGRVVDVLADAQGRVRAAIIDFGGFLGVGNRRIAVDWPLLRFDLNARDKPLILSVDRQKLQSAPEYNSNKPRVLMPPAAPDAADTGQATK